MKVRSVLLAVLLTAPTVPAIALASGPSCTPGWVAGWYAAPVQTVPGLSDRTYRSIITVKHPGRQIRLRLTNALGTHPVHVDAVSAGILSSVSSLQPGTVRAVRFHGKPGITVAAGTDAFSDPIPLVVQGMQKIAVSFFSATDTGPLTGHTSEPADAGGPPSDVIPIGLQTESHTSFLSVPGDHTRDEAGTAFVQPDDSAALVDGIDVLPTVPTAGVVALGDSITDGFGSLPNADGSWPDDLSRRLLTAHVPTAVVNAGISGGRVVTPAGRGPSAVDRMARDVLSQSGLRAVIVLEGINDIGAGATSAQVIAGYQRLIKVAHSKGIRVYGGLLTPSGDLMRPAVENNYSTPTAVAARHEVNRWITTSKAFDGVIDFESAVREADSADHWQLALTVDGLHGNTDGYQRMADAVSLKVLPTGCRGREGR